MKPAKLKIGQTHKAPSASSVAKVINMGGKSPLIEMALDPQHRPTVLGYMHDAAWQASHCAERGDVHDKDKWWRIAENLAKVLSATKLMHDIAAGRLGR